MTPEKLEMLAVKAHVADDAEAAAAIALVKAERKQRAAWRAIQKGAVALAGLKLDGEQHWQYTARVEALRMAAIRSAEARIKAAQAAEVGGAS